jgi:hypothetical protein
VKSQIQVAKRARKGIEQIRKKLLCPTPESVSACAGPLTEAIDCMQLIHQDLLQQRLQRALPGRGLVRALGTEIVHLRQELSEANALLQSAAAFHEGYFRLLRSRQQNDAGYSRLGTTLQPPEARRFIFHG